MCAPPPRQPSRRARGGIVRTRRRVCRSGVCAESIGSTIPAELRPRAICQINDLGIRILSAAIRPPPDGG